MKTKNLFTSFSYIFLFLLAINISYAFQAVTTSYSADNSIGVIAISNISSTNYPSSMYQNIIPLIIGNSSTENTTIEDYIILDITGTTISIPQTETCGNSIDDDNDGQTDEGCAVDEDDEETPIRFFTSAPKQNVTETTPVENASSVIQDTSNPVTSTIINLTEKVGNDFYVYIARDDSFNYQANDGEKLYGIFKLNTTDERLDLNQVLFTFKVEKTWFENESYYEKIQFYGYFQDWNKLPVMKTNEDPEYVYYLSKASGAKQFKISIQNDEKKINTQWYAKVYNIPKYQISLLQIILITIIIIILIISLVHYIRLGKCDDCDEE